MNEARGLDSFYEEDFNAFMSLFDELLWNADSETVMEGETGRTFVSTRRGLLGRRMPKFLREEGGIGAELYRMAKEKCYDAIDRLGLAGVAGSIRKYMS